MGIMTYVADTKNAQEVVDKYVETSMESNELKTIEYSEIEGTEKINLGNNLFLGRGLVGKYEWNEEKKNVGFFIQMKTLGQYKWII